MFRRLAACAVLLSGCSPTVFTCLQDSQCGADGTCVMEHCAFPSDACGGELEFGSLAGDLSGECVGDPAAVTTSGTGTMVPGSTTETPGTLTGADEGMTTSVAETVGVDDSSGGTTGPGGTSTDGTSSGGETGTLFVASYATCAFVGQDRARRMNPDPGGCSALAGANAFTVDGDVPPNAAAVGYLIFDLGTGFARRDVADVRLYLSTTLAVDAGGAETGEISLVLPFSEESIEAQVPLDVGVLAPDQGFVGQGEEVEWVLPADVVGSNKTMLYFAVRKQEIDGVDYFTHTGEQPPRLVVTLK